MNGVGYDVDTKAPIGPGALGASNPWGATLIYDTMSTCTSATRWTSVRGWEKDVTLLAHTALGLERLGVSAPASGPTGQDVAAAARRSAPAPALAGDKDATFLRVRATVRPDGASIDTIKPRTGTALGGTAQVRYGFVARDASGRELARVAAHTLGDTVLGDLPAVQRLAAVELVDRDGKVLATHRPSASAPTVTQLTADAAGRLRWRSADADGDARTVKVDVATGDGGWRSVYAGPDRGEATVPAGLGSGGAAPTWRVRVSDGFHEVAALATVR